MTPMCGFAGEFLFRAARADLELVCRMAQRLRHRGPDEDGRYLSPDGRCAIGFRRLSVIDPAASHQPMSSPDGMVTIAFNGEIYNFLELRRELESQGCTFTTAGDTEVLLHLYQRDGLAMLERLEGMFAFAIYDARQGRLLLSRDRLGEKPLWYAQLPDRIVFASEAKALLLHPQVDKGYSQQAIVNYVSIGYIHGPGSIWPQVFKLPPAHFMILQEATSEPHRYWQPALAEKLPPKPADQVELVREMVAASVRQRMIADVPLGALLSGGVDSSIVVALMSEVAGRSGGVKSFTAGFDDPLYDEREAAREVARHCGTDHTELLIQPRPSTEMIDEIVERYDEPFADSSSIPTFLICRATRQHVTVALTGDGGDEIFGGYDRYRALMLAEKLTPFGYLAVKVAAGIATIFAGTEERGRLRRLIRFAEILTEPYSIQYLKYRQLFASEDFEDLFTPEFIAQTDLTEPARWFEDLYEFSESSEFPDEVTRAQHNDLVTYLPDDLLVKSDIASMASSLELRAPMLSHRLVPIGLSLPLEMRIRKGHGKAVLKDAFGHLLPPAVFTRPKRGFGVPLGSWLRNELAGVMKETLLDRSFIDRGIIKGYALQGLINDHLSGRADHRHRLWALLVLARWLDKHA